MKLFSSTIQDKYYFKVGNECFISAHSESGNSVGVLLSSIDLNMGKFEKFLIQATSELNSSFQNITLKVIGGISFIQTLKKEIEKLNFRDTKYVERIGGFEVIYHPEKGLLRVSKIDTKIVEDKIVKVLIVDDSKTIRNLLSKMLSKSSRIEVVATAEKPSEVEELIKKHKPDVITLDIHMPEMNGVDLLKIIQPKFNIPTIMITSVSVEEGPLVLDALDSGAFDYIQKPSMEEIAEVGPILIEKVVEASKFKRTKESSSSLVSRSVQSFDKNCKIVIGSSTGGTTALMDILSGLPKSIPPILVVQHIPAVFSKAFAERINDVCPFTVKEAEDGELVIDDTVYIAPGGKQMKIRCEDDNSYIVITDDAPVNRFKPSVDYLFNSIEQIARKEHVLAVILTGMGKDGAKGMKRLKDLGALTIAQNEESCVVYGMPKVAIEIGAVTDIVHKDQIANKLVELSYKISTKKAS